MMNSRSIASTSKLLAIVVAVCAALGASRVAEAGRKRVVVLDFDGPKGEKFHADLVKLIKKTHTVVPTTKWNTAAEQLSAGALSDKNIKKVARKLKIDAVVEGQVEKRREEYILRIRLHGGKSGELIGDAITTKAQTAKLDGRAQRDLRDELLGAIDNVESNRLGGTDDEADAPATVARSDDDAERPGKKVKKAEAEADDADARPAKKGFARRGDDERGADRTERRGKKTEREPDDDDATAGKKPAKKSATDDAVLASQKPAAKSDGDSDAAVDDDKPARSKRVAARDDTDAAEVDAARTGPRPNQAVALSPGERALEAVGGLSVTSRSMSFTVATNATTKPPGYAGTPVAGVMLDVIAYPLAFGHDRTDQLKNVGVEILYDRVISINSKDAQGNTYPTTESRYWLTAMFRHAFGRDATAPVVIGSLGYGGQSFEIQGNIPLPSVTYAIVAPGAGLRYPATEKLTFAVDTKVLFPLSTGQIQNADRYGAASVFGFEGALGADYLITPNIFARAMGRFETLGFNFKGTGDLKASGARDSYFGGALTVGYLY